EFAQMFRRFGSEVTVAEMSSRLVPREDEDVSTAIKEILEREGVDVRVESKCIGFEKSGVEIRMSMECAGDRHVNGSHVLLAVGRRPNTDDLGLEKAGARVDDKGYIAVDDEFRTSVPSIWALG